MSKTIKRVAYVTGFSLLNSLLNFLYQMIIASYYGVSSATDTYFLAFTIPEWVMNVTIMILPIALIPSFTKQVETEGKEAAWKLASVFISYLAIGLSFLALMIIFGANQISQVLHSSIESTDQVQLSLHIRIMIFSVVFNNLAWAMNGISMANDRYLMPAISPLLQTAIMILFIIFGSDSLGIVSASYGVLFGSIFQFLIVIAFLPRPGFKVDLRLRNSGIRSVLSLFIPLLMGNIILKSEVFLNRFLAGLIGVGSISILFFGSRIIRLLARLTSKGIGMITFATQSRQFATGDREGFKRTFDQNFKVVLYIACFAALMLAAGGIELISLVFERGEFSRDAASITYYATIGMLGVLIAFPVGDIVNNALSSIHRTKVITGVNLLLFIPMIGLRLLLQSRFGIVGLSIGSSIAALLSSFILLCVLMFKFKLVNRVGILHTVGRALLSVAFSTLALLVGFYVIRQLDLQSEFLGYLFAGVRMLFVAIIFGISVLIIEPELAGILIQKSRK
jgi:putative peptidoglycan lipid II flippase